MSALQTVFYGLASLGGLGTLASVINAMNAKSKIRAESKKIGVDADVVVSDQALKMYTLARKEAQEAKREAAECRRLVTALESHVDKLERIMWSNGLKPPLFTYTPLSKAD